MARPSIWEDETPEGRVVRAFIEALNDHWAETGHAEKQTFIMPKGKADCICAICGTILYDGPLLDQPDA